MSDREHAVRMGTSVTEGERLSDLLPRLPEDVRARVLDQLWLRTVLVEQRRSTTLAERTAFDERGDRILELLDPQEQVRWTPEEGEHYRLEMHRHAEEKAQIRDAARHYLQVDGSGGTFDALEMAHARRELVALIGEPEPWTLADSVRVVRECEEADDAH